MDQDLLRIFKAQNIEVVCESPLELESVQYAQFNAHLDNPEYERFVIGTATGDLADMIIEYTLRLDKLRRSSYRKLKERGEIEGFKLLPYEKLTCSSCNQCLGCDYRFDDYNTNGDCLAVK
jgi:hypothetical protein